jgi:hypothetical protein
MDNIISVIQGASLIVGIIGTIIGIIGGIAAIYFAQQNHALNQELSKQTALATMDLRISKLPPYTSVNEYSEVVIKNVGTRVSGDRLTMKATCSWAEEIEFHLLFPSPSWKLHPNEEFRWKIRFGYSGNLKGEKISLIASDVNHTWENIERII